MTDDIVEQLRHRAKWDIIAGSSFDIGMCRDAADEIERLRRLITEWADAEEGYFDISTKEGQRKVDRLDAAEDALRKAVGR